MSDVVDLKISQANDAGSYDPSWIIPIARPGSSLALSTTAGKLREATTDTVASLNFINGGIIGGSIAPDDAYQLDKYYGVISKWSNTLRQWVSSAPILVPEGDSVLAVVIENGGTISGAANFPDDGYILDKYSGVVRKWDSSSKKWKYSAPVEAPEGDISILNSDTATIGEVIPNLITMNGVNIYEGSSGGDPAPGMRYYLDKYYGVIQKMKANGEFEHQTGSSPSSVNILGKFTGRLTSKPITFLNNIDSTPNTTYTFIMTIEGLGTLFRFLVPAAKVGPCPIKMNFAFTDIIDPINPSIGGVAQPWTDITWINNGQDVEYIDQQNTLNNANMIPPSTTFNLPQAEDGNSGGNLQIFRLYPTDWMPFSSPLRADGGSGASMVVVRLEIGATGTLTLATNTGDIAGAWDVDWSGRTFRSYSQVCQGVTTPSSFTSTTRVGVFAVQGIQYESVNPGVQLMPGGDSTVAGTAALFTVQGAWRQVQMAHSTLNTPVELANFGQPASDFFTFDVQYGLEFDLIKPTIVHLQTLSRNSWKNNSLKSGDVASNGHGNTLQIKLTGTFVTGNNVTVTVTDTNVAGSPLAISYNAQAGDTNLSILAASVAANLQATSALFSAGYRAFSNGPWANLVFPSVLPTAGTVTTTGSLVAIGYFNYVWISQYIADRSLAASLSMASRAQKYGAVPVFVKIPGDIGYTLQVDALRTKINAMLDSMSSKRIVVDFDTGFSTATGPAGAPQMPIPSLSADGVHPNPAAITSQFHLLDTAYKFIYGL